MTCIKGSWKQPAPPLLDFLFLVHIQSKMSQAIHLKLNDGKQIPALAWG